MEYFDVSVVVRKVDALKKEQKILFMVQIPPPVHGAALRNLSLYESKILRQRFTIRLLALAFSEKVSSIGKLSLIKIVRSVTYSAKLFLNLITFRPDIAYFTITPSGGAFYRDVLFVLILKLFNPDIIYHLRGLGVKTAMQKGLINRLTYRFVFKNSFVVCLSEKHLLDVADLTYKEHFVVPNGIPIEIPYESNGFKKSEKTTFLYLSNFIRSKGVLVFLDALKKLQTYRTDFQAVLVGADFDLTKKDVEEYASKAGLSSRVRVQGPRYGADKFKAITDCDVFVFPTYFELFPGVVLEAMQVGRPIITTTTGAIPEMIDHNINGLLVEPKDVDALAEKMNFLIENPEIAQKLARNAREKFYKCFTVDRFETNMKSVFEQVLEKKSHRK